eukprot:1102665_1
MEPDDAHHKPKQTRTNKSRMSHIKTIEIVIGFKVKGDKNMVPKFHYYRHIIDLCVVLKMPIGLMETHHRICNVVRSHYLNQRGKAGIMHSINEQDPFDNITKT